jgi:hypothetical protein
VIPIGDLAIAQAYAYACTITLGGGSGRERTRAGRTGYAIVDSSEELVRESELALEAAEGAAHFPGPLDRGTARAEMAGVIIHGASSSLVLGQLAGTTSASIASGWRLYAPAGLSPPAARVDRGEAPEAAGTVGLHRTGHRANRWCCWAGRELRRGDTGTSIGHRVYTHLTAKGVAGLVVVPGAPFPEGWTRRKLSNGSAFCSAACEDVWYTKLMPPPSPASTSCPRPRESVKRGYLAIGWPRLRPSAAS